MAKTCSCNAQGKSNLGCSCNADNKKIAPRTVTSWTAIAVAAKITPDKLTTIQQALKSETTTRSIAVTDGGSWLSVAAGGKITAATFNQIKNTINACNNKDISAVTCTCNIDKSGCTSNINNKVACNCQTHKDTIAAMSWTDLTGSNTAVAAKIWKTIVDNFRTHTNTLQKRCICNCNYCTCQCNYCTCNCNYCTCNCNYCTCDCNYACTCQCNYACTCQCNYSCTCNCAYACKCNCNYSCKCNCNYSCKCQCNYSCTCNCNYWCTCQCAYSDKRLKENIEYL